MFLPAVSLTNGVQISSFDHNEVHDGKTLLDGFFGLVTMALERHVDEQGNCAVLPNQVAQAVAGRLPNTTVRLIRFEEKWGVPQSSASEWLKSLLPQAERNKL